MKIYFSDFTSSDVGEYYVNITNNSGITTSRKCDISLLENPPLIKEWFLPTGGGPAPTVGTNGKIYVASSSKKIGGHSGYGFYGLSQSVINKLPLS